MRKILLAAFSIALSSSLFAQNDTTVRTIRKTAVSEGSSDHFLLQLGYTSWNGKPDSIKTKGFPRAFNLYLMLDFPFRTNNHWSVAVGPGISTDNIFFDKMYVGLKDLSSTLEFRDVSDTSHFKKYKMSTAYLEAPVELRYRFNPSDDKKSVKIALGVKVATLLSAGVKGKDLQDKNGKTILPYTEKEKSKRFLNKNRLSVTGRLGIGHFSVFGSYAITPLFKEGFAPTMRPMTIGLTLSGL